MTIRHSPLVLIAVMSLCVAMVAGISITLLYQAAFAQQSARLVETVQSRARLIESIFQFSLLSVDSPHRDRAISATQNQVTTAHKDFGGFGNTGEFTLATLQNDMIVFLVSHRHHDLETPSPVSMSSELAQPMRLALNGKSGTVVALDYRGETVLAAHEPISGLNWGIVAKLDLKEVREPFITAGMYAALAAAVLISIGAILFFRVANPLVRKLQDSETRFRTLAETSPFGIYLTSCSGDITYANPAWQGMLGLNEQQMLGPAWLSRLHPSDSKETVARWNAACDEKRFMTLEYRLGQGDSTIWVSGTASPILNAQGNVESCVGTAIDITAQRMAEKQMRRQANFDALTGLHNRRHFDEVLASEWLRGIRNHSMLSIIMIDVDNFKAYNDHYGHDAGDECLKKIAHTLSSVLHRPADNIARYGGEEFIALLPETDLRSARRIAQQMVQASAALQIPHASSPVLDHVTVSAGTASIVPNVADSPRVLIRIADKGLYQAKSEGRNREHCAQES